MASQPYSNAQKEKGCHSGEQAPSGILYVDNMDLFIFAKYSTESAECVAHRMQDMTTHWQGCL
jgi:hypothetical protein